MNSASAVIREEHLMAISEKEFRKLALGDPSGHWELHCGVPHQKPGMTAQHNDVLDHLHELLSVQLDRREFRVRSEHGHVRTSADRYYILDLFVVPTEQFLPQAPLRTLETYERPLPLVVEISRLPPVTTKLKRSFPSTSVGAILRSGTSTRMTAPSPLGNGSLMGATWNHTMDAALSSQLPFPGWRLTWTSCSTEGLMCLTGGRGSRL
jgi:hypothetical protein